jgi:putative Mg2+ transporter-C (MgtC) family protein
LQPAVLLHAAGANSREAAMWQDILAMIVSTVLGGLVGLERQMGRKPAGLRTHVLVCLGSTLFVLITQHAVRGVKPEGVNVNWDPTRIIHGIITGVGFLGAGSIMRRDGDVYGLTTAASIWMAAGIGVAVGVYAWGLAVLGTVLALIVLEGLRWVERFMEPDGSGPHHR